MTKRVHAGPCSTASITKKGAHFGEVHETGNPPGISGNISEVMSGEVLKLCPRLLLKAQFTIDQRQARPPGRALRRHLHKAPYDRGQFLEASLFAAQGKHLHAEDPKRVLAPQSLPDSQGLLGESLAFLKAPRKDGPHGPEGCVYIEVERLP